MYILWRVVDNSRIVPWLSAKLYTFNSLIFLCNSVNLAAFSRFLPISSASLINRKHRLLPDFYTFHSFCFLVLPHIPCWNKANQTSLSGPLWQYVNALPTTISVPRGNSVSSVSQRRGRKCKRRTVRSRIMLFFFFFDYMASLPLPPRTNHCTWNLCHRFCCPEVLCMGTNLRKRSMYIVWSLTTVLSVSSSHPPSPVAFPNTWLWLAIRICGREQNWAGDHSVRN